MTIGLLGAMEEEIKPLLRQLPEAKVTRYGQNNYYETTYKNINIVIAYSKIGKVNAALTATTLIEKFKIEKLIFTGVAGALNRDLKIGDLVIGKKLVQHDVDITEFGHKPGYIPESGDYFESDKELVELAKKSSESLGLDLIEGIIATGDQFIADFDKKEFIMETFTADAVEMEGASVAYVCQCLKIPFIVLRSISDGADMEAGFNFDAFLEKSAENSGKLSLKMLDGLI